MKAGLVPTSKLIHVDAIAHASSRKLFIRILIKFFLLLVVRHLLLVASCYY